MSMPTIECNNIDKCCAASSLLQSIALEETAISHILNAEGENYRKPSPLPVSRRSLSKSTTPWKVWWIRLPA